jgi:flagellar L-ring protein precursor FlgH
MVRELLLIAGLGSLLAATPGFAQSSKPSTDTYDQAVARHLETARTLARASSAQPDEPSIDWITGLTADRRASRVNDLITVRVIENIESTATADARLDKSSKAKAAVPTMFGLETKLPDSIDPGNLASTSYDSAFKGSGTTTRTSMLTATMTTRVSEVLPNGDLVLEGVREIDLNGERQVVVLTGIVRAQDLRRSNQVLSTQVAQLRIQYYGKGLLKDNLKPGWLVRILNQVF